MVCLCRDCPCEIDYTGVAGCASHEFPFVPIYYSLNLQTRMLGVLDCFVQCIAMLSWPSITKAKKELRTKVL